MEENIPIVEEVDPSAISDDSFDETVDELDLD